MRALSDDVGRTAGPAGSGRRGALDELARSVFNAWDAHVAVLDEDGSILAVNEAWRRYGSANGADPDTCGVGVNYLDVCRRATDAAAGSSAAFLDGLQQLRAGTLNEFTLEYPCQQPGDQPIWYRMQARRLGTSPGAPRLLIVHEDISARRQLQDDALARSRLLDEVDAAVIATDLDGVVTLWSQGAERLYDLPATEAVGACLDRLIAPADASGDVACILSTVLALGRWEGELRSRRRDGTKFPLYLRSSVLHDTDDQPRGVVVVGSDLTNRDAMLGQIHASHRELQAITSSIGEGLCTLDDEGLITYLNPQGQRLLRLSSAEARGGSFVYWLRTADGSELQLNAKASGGANRPVTCRLQRHDGSELPIEYVATPLNAEADGAGTGGWVVVFRDITDRLAGEQQIERRIEQSQWVDRISDALANEGFVLHAQPIIDVATGRVVQNELLVRMLDADDPEVVIPPGRFLPIAELLGLAPEIDRWVLARGLELAADGLPVEINLSATSLDDPSLPSYIEQLLHESGADPTLVVFEITETALLANDATAGHFAERIHALGCKLALDDFGTGYGGFTYLKRLPVDYLKIDIEFVRDAVTNPASRHVIDAVVSLSQAFGLRTVAEGVEDADTFALLRELDVDLAQGYYLGRPAPITADTFDVQGAGFGSSGAA